jgi:midasin (ATPase involved in ribosome maturation)
MIRVSKLMGFQRGQKVLQKFVAKCSNEKILKNLIGHQTYLKIKLKFWLLYSMSNASNSCLVKYDI